MNKIINIFLLVLLFLILIFLISVIPELISVRQGELLLDIKQPFIQIGNYFTVLKDGDIFTYIIRGHERNFLDAFPRFFVTSFVYLISSLLTGTILGVLFGLILSGEKGLIVRNILSLIGHIPDFVLIVILQLLVIVFKDVFGFRLMKVASAGGSYAIVLPLISMSLFPLIYMMKIVSQQTFLIRGQSYILYAKAKGLSRKYIFFKHILPGIFPLISAELPRTTGLIIANLFIVERLYNISGITRFLFFVLGISSSAGNSRIDFVQGHVVVNTLFGFVLLFVLSFGIMLIITNLIKRILCRG